MREDASVTLAMDDVLGPSLPILFFFANQERFILVVLSESVHDGSSTELLDLGTRKEANDRDRFQLRNIAE